VEHFDLEEMPWQTHLATDRLLMLFLKPAVLIASEENRPSHKIVLPTGRVGFNPGGTKISVSSLGPVRQLCVRVAESSLMEVAGGLGWTDQLEFTSDKVIGNSQLTSLLYALEAERRSGYPSGPLFVEGVELALSVLLVKLYCVFPRRGSRDTSHERKSGSLSLALPAHLLKKTLDRMRDLTADLSLDMLASEIGYSRRHFLRMFQQATGATPHQYLLQLRIEHAQHLIKDGNLPLIDVAGTCGFSSHAHMSRVFRKLLGVSPSGYRRNS
jgi:AraC-like DNA-binding protein